MDYFKVQCTGQYKDRCVCGLGGTTGVARWPIRVPPKSHTDPSRHRQPHTTGATASRRCTASASSISSSSSPSRWGANCRWCVRPLSLLSTTWGRARKAHVSRIHTRTHTRTIGRAHPRVGAQVPGLRGLPPRHVLRRQQCVGSRGGKGGNDCGSRLNRSPAYGFDRMDGMLDAPTPK